MLDDKGETIERYEYSEISIGEPIASEMFEPAFSIAENSTASSGSSNEAGIKKAHSELKKSVRDKNKDVEGNVRSQMASGRRWQLNWVPQGFAVQTGRAAEIQKVNGSISTPTLAEGREGSLIYSDGLSAFTVFVAENVNLGSHSMRNGATTALTQVRKDEDSVYSVTVVGELPRRAVERVAQSVIPVGR